jgi:hypothetical protein
MDRARREAARVFVMFMFNSIFEFVECVGGGFNTVDTD